MSLKSKFILFSLIVFGLPIFFYISTKISAHSATGSWRYRMTVTVSTPEGDKTGTSVREVTAHTGGISLPESQASVSLKGEAVVVDLGKRGLLFALLTGYKLQEENATDLPGYIFKHRYGQFSAEGIREMTDIGGYEELTEEWYPRFIHFRDITNPKTAENVMTFKSCGLNHICMESNNIEKIFGKGVHIKSVTIEMTRDEVTSGIEKWIPWLPDRIRTPGYFGGTLPSYADPTKTFLTSADFSEGIYK